MRQTPIMTLIRSAKGTPKRGEVKKFAEALARLFHGEFARLTSWGQSTPYLLTLQLPEGARRVTFDLGTTIERVHEALEGVMQLLTSAGLVVPSPNPDCLCLLAPSASASKKVRRAGAGPAKTKITIAVHREMLDICGPFLTYEEG